MNAVLALLEQAAIEKLLGNDPPLTGKTKTGMSLFALSGFLAAVGLVFLIVGAFLHLDTILPTGQAAMLTGGLVFIVSAFCVLGGFIILKIKETKLKKVKQEMMQTFQTALSFLEEEMADPIKENPKTAVSTAALAGYVVGEKYF